MQKNEKILIDLIESKYGSIYRASTELGLSYSTLWRWKNGKQKPKLETIEHLMSHMKELEVSLVK